MSDGPTASWHPAMMPNSIADLAKEPAVLPPSQPEQPITGAHDKTASLEDLLERDEAANEQKAVDAWFPDEDAGENWLEQETGDVTKDTTEGIDAQVEDAVPNTSSAASKHLSTMSFARTVSHEVSFNDDDEGDAEFEFTRTSTDPFKFMPPNDRTNSFPVVPPRDSQPQQALPSNQAENILKEVELEQEQEEPDSFFAKAAQHADEEGFLDDDNERAPHQYIGGDLHGTTEEASEARFAEGLPLISHDRDSHNNTESEDTTAEAFGGNDGGEEDDFFAQVRESDPENSADAPKQGIQRISTMQVLTGMGVEATPSSFDAVEEERDETPLGGVIAEGSNERPLKAEAGEDLDAKWQAMFAGDEEDDFLLEEDTAAKSVDPEGFLGSDDEGLLDDGEDIPPSTQPPQTQSPGMNGHYSPQGQPTNPMPSPSNPYAPAPAPVSSRPAAQTTYSAPQAVPKPASYGFGAPMAPPELNKAQSFVDKAKGGYTSPYDLPMDVVQQPKKRVSMQNLQRSAVTPPGAPVPQGPPRSASLQAQQTPPIGSAPSASKQALAKKESFFEDLPATAKPRPASRQSNKSLPSPSLPGPQGLPQTSSTPMAPPPQTQPHLAEISKLVAPERVGPYASIGGSPPAPSIPAATSTRYSPAPAPTTNGATPSSSSNRYSPAPGGARPPSGGYSHANINTPPVLPHLPRTSSPLAHFEISHAKNQGSGHGELGHGERRSSSALHEARLQRVPSLPPTSEVDEEDSSSQAPDFSQQAPPPSQRYAQLPSRARQTPPPPGQRSTQTTLSPPKRSNSSYGPSSASLDFVPPPRSQTQSPGALYGDRRKSIDPIPRPSSVHSPTSSQAGGYGPAQISHTVQSQPHSGTTPARPVMAPRSRGLSQNFSLIPPTDGRENDPLQRWQGSPLFTWGVGGTMVTMFPKNVPRYGIKQNVPTVMRSPGEVRIRNMKDIDPLEERLSKFPGPLKGKSKKKEITAWLTTGIEGLERSLPTAAFQAHPLHEDKRAAERILLWKILRLFIEHDGALDGNSAVEKAVREVLSPDLNNTPAAPVYTAGTSMAELPSESASKAQADAIDPSTVEQIRTNLLAGDRDKAVWAAVDKRLWGHAMLIANTVSPDLYKQVAQEFVKKEVNFPGHNNESLAALYEVLSGNHEESVDELVPVHARAGLQLMAKDSTSGISGDAMAGLDKWRETLGLILSNRSTEDARAINSLGSLLSGYGRAEAAHICFLFARNHTVFGGLDDPASHFVLVGSDHRRQVQQFAKESEPLLLSEVYEYGLSLAGGSAVAVTNPHLAGYKFQHALTLAEYGFRDKALQYCEAIFGAITAQTRRSPYHHVVLEASVDDLMKRLKQAPKEESSSWIPKPSMNKVSDSVWNRFNKFVAGEDNENSGPGTGIEGDESGPFARLPGGTPTISRPSSTSNFETFGASIPGYPMANGPLPVGAPISTSRASSRYAPAPVQSVAPGNPYEATTAYAPTPPSEQGSNELGHGLPEMSRQSSEFQATNFGNPYAPQNHTLPTQGHQSSRPVSQQNEQPLNANVSSEYEPFGYSNASTNGYQPTSQFSKVEESTSAQEETPTPSGYQAPSYGYEPPSLTPYESPAAQYSEKAPAEAVNGSSYEPPSLQSYQPPSYEPYNPPAESDGNSDTEKPKPRRGIMYDDEDDFGAPKVQEKNKSDKDRENEEMFRKIAEQEAKADADKKAATAKKGWGFGGWFGGGGAKKDAPPPEASPNKPIRAKLGEANSFYFDPDLKRWVNKNGGPDDNVKKATPPPPKAPLGTPRSAMSTPPPPGPTSNPDLGRASAPPAGPPRALTPSSQLGVPGPGSAPPGGAPPMMRSASGASVASGPPSRPATALSTTSSIDDLLGPAGSRTKGPKKSRKSGRYVDVMAKP